MSEIIQEEKKRKKTIILAFIAVVLVAGLIIAYIYKSQQKYAPPPPTPKVDLTGTKDIAKESWISQSAAQMQTQKKEIDDLKKTMSDMEVKNRPGQLPAGFPPPPSMTQDHKPAGSLPLGVPSPPTAQQPQRPGAYPPPPQSPSHPAGQVDNQVKPGAVSEKQLTNLIAIDEGKGASSSSDQKKDKHETKKNEDKDTPKNDSYIPAGSFVKVVLLNGIDAPTGSKGKGSPYPVLLRVLQFAQLPNMWRGDFKECFIIGEAVGELSSERVHIRTNTLSCINKKGDVLEGTISGYAVGEDGKIGLSGRVVTKQGAILARSLVAGFLQGVSSAFSQSANVLNITPTGNLSTIDPSKSLQAGVGMGVSKASEDLAKFYIDLAKELFPVIEANAGRQVEVVLVSKASLNKIAK